MTTNYKIINDEIHVDPSVDKDIFTPQSHLFQFNIGDEVILNKMGKKIVSTLMRELPEDISKYMSYSINFKVESVNIGEVDSLLRARGVCRGSIRLRGQLHSKPFYITINAACVEPADRPSTETHRYVIGAFNYNTKSYSYVNREGSSHTLDVTDAMTFSTPRAVMDFLRSMSYPTRKGGVLTRSKLGHNLFGRWPEDCQYDILKVQVCTEPIAEFKESSLTSEKALFAELLQRYSAMYQQYLSTKEEKNRKRFGATGTSS